MSSQAIRRFASENGPGPSLWLMVSLPVEMTSQPSFSSVFGAAPGQSPRPTTATLASSTKVDFGEYSILTRVGDNT